jgi:glycosyltransferase involved in cell wall biosynthesis
VGEKRIPAAVSVALCTFQGAGFVAEQVASILSQSHPATELVVADDGSTDGTVAIIEQLVAEYPAAPSLVLLPPETRPLGVAGNFARALAACTGDLIALSDQDDVWHPDRLARLRDRLGDPGDIVAVHADARLVDATGVDLGETLFDAIGLSSRERAAVDEGRALEVLLRRNVATGATMIVTRGLRDAALPIPPGWIHDEWLAVVAAIDGRLVRLDETLTDYRQHGGNQIGAGSIGMSDRLDRLREPRGARNRRLLERARALAARYPSGGGAPLEATRLIAGKLRHEERRSALPAVRVARLPAIVAELARGGYRDYGGGLQDVLRDAVQPAGNPGL